MWKKIECTLPSLASLGRAGCIIKVSDITKPWGSPKGLYMIENHISCFSIIHICYKQDQWGLYMSPSRESAVVSKPTLLVSCPNPNLSNCVICVYWGEVRIVWTKSHRGWPQFQILLWKPCWQKQRYFYLHFK